MIIDTHFISTINTYYTNYDYQHAEQLIISNIEIIKTLYLNNFSEFINYLSNITNVEHFLKCVNISFWELFFNYKLIQSGGIMDMDITVNYYYKYYNNPHIAIESLNTILFHYSDVIKTQNDIDVFFQENKTRILDNIDICINYSECLVKKYGKGYSYYSILLQYFVEKCFNIELWEHYINEIASISFHKLKYIYSKHNWVFLNIHPERLVDILKNQLDIRIVHSDIDRMPNFKIFCRDTLAVFNIIHPIIFNQSVYIDFLYTYINKICVLHKNTKILDSILHIYKSVFCSIDIHGYNPLVDILRYGDITSLLWFDTHILETTDITHKIFVNVVYQNDGVEYALQNTNKQIIKVLLDIMSNKCSSEFIVEYMNKCKSFCTIQRYIINKYKIKNFRYKITKLLSFYIKHNSLPIELVYILLSYEKHIIDESPFILHFLYQNINTIHPSIYLDINKIEIHKHYINERDICTLSSFISRDTSPHKITLFILKNIIGETSIHTLEALSHILFSTQVKQPDKLDVPGLSDMPEKQLLYHIKQFDCAYTLDNWKHEIDLEYILLGTYTKSLSNVSSDNNLENSIINYGKTIINNHNIREFLKKNIWCTSHKINDTSSSHINFIQRIYTSVFINRFFTEYIYKKYTFILKTNIEFYYNNYNYDKESLDIFYQDSTQSILNTNKEYGYMIGISYILENYLNRLDTSTFINTQTLYTKLKRYFGYTTIIYNNLSQNNIENMIITNLESIDSYSRLNSKLRIIKSRKKIEHINNVIIQNIKRIKNENKVRRLRIATLFLYSYIINKRNRIFKLHHNSFINSLRHINTVKCTDNLLVHNSLHEHVDIFFNNILCITQTIHDTHYINDKDTQPDNIYKFPIHQSFSELIYNFKTHSVITEKIDGVPKYNIKLVNTFPKYPFKSNVDVEFIKNDRIYFIYGFCNDISLKNTNFVDEIESLRRVHPFTKNNMFKTLVDTHTLCSTEFKHFLVKEKDNYNKYILESKKYKNKLLWWPKKYFQLSYKTLEEYLYLIYLFTDREERSLHIFKNDGWILQHNLYSSDEDVVEAHLLKFKIKPREQLTIDLLYKDNTWCDRILPFKQYNIEYNTCDLLAKNNCIYRCYPIFNKDSNELVSFVPRDLRTDKRYANTSEIISKVITIINRTFTIKDLLFQYDQYKTGSKPSSYYTLCRFNKPKIGLNHYSLNHYTKTVRFITGHIVDLGAGFKTKHYLKDIEFESCTVYDNDISCLFSNLENKNNIEFKYKYRYLDFTKELTDYSPFENTLIDITTLKTNSVDTIMMINSFNFALKNIDVFMKYINTISKPLTKLIIRFMDYSLLDNYITSIHPPLTIDSPNIIIKSPFNSSFINYNIKNKTNRIYYTWAHSKPIDEICINRASIETHFKKYGWNTLHYENIHSINDSNITETHLWEYYFRSFSCISFEKS